MTYSNGYRNTEIRRDFWLRDTNLRVTSMSIKNIYGQKLFHGERRQRKKGRSSGLGYL